MAEPIPAEPKAILSNRATYLGMYPINGAYRFSLVKSSGISGLKKRLSGQNSPDTPLASFYRLYIFLVLDMNTQLRNELEYFFSIHPDWAVKDIPDPRDPNPERYAILAVLTKLMCLAFNNKIEKGLPRNAPPIIEDFAYWASKPKVLERQPAWSMQVPRLAKPLLIPNEYGKTCSVGDPTLCNELKDWGVYMTNPHIMFV